MNSTLAFLALTPDQTGYRIVDGDSIVSSGLLEGGASRSRSDVDGATATCDVQFTLNQYEYNYLWAFYRGALERGANTFQINLTFEDSLPQLYTVKMVPKTFGVLGIVGLTYVVGCTLEVTPQPDNVAADLSLVDVYAAYGDTALSLFNQLNVLVNTQLPATL